MQTLKSPKLAWFSLSVFYMYQYILRVFPNIAEQELRTDLLLNAVEFSTLGAFYLYAYGGLQLPLGALVDKYGLKRVALFSILSCILGTVVFYSATTLWHLQVGRILMGMGSAPVFMAALKICADYIPPAHRGVYMGITLTLGTLGALMSGSIVVSLLDVIGWRLAVLATGVAGLLIVILLLTNLPKHTAPQTSGALIDWQTLKPVFKNRSLYVYGILGLGFFASLTVFADLWGTLYLMKRYGINRSTAATASMTMYIGLAIGSIALPWYFSAKQKLFTGLRLCASALLILLPLFILTPNLPLFAAQAILCLMGIFAGGVMLAFSGASFFTTRETSGLTLSIINTFNMFGSALLNQAVGGTLDWLWDGSLSAQAVRQYNIEAFNQTFLIILGALFLVSFTLAMRLRKPKYVKKGD